MLNVLFDSCENDTGKQDNIHDRAAYHQMYHKKFVIPSEASEKKLPLKMRSHLA